MIQEREAFDLIVRQLCELRGESKTSITAETRLYEDLGIFGDDWDDVLRALQRVADIDWSGFHCSRYFKSEPHLLSWFVWLREWAKRSKRRPLTVGHLARVVARGRWFEPSAAQANPAVAFQGRTVLQPEFPIRVTFHEDGDEWVLDSIDEVACTLECFDSDDPEENASVIDGKGRPVRIKVEALQVLRFELLSSCAQSCSQPESGSDGTANVLKSHG